MTKFLYKNVHLQAYAYELPETELTSAEIEDRLAPLYQRLEIPFGTLERVSGIRARRVWPLSTAPSQAATMAVEKALADLPFAREEIGALVSCSVSRDYFEPATACLVHRNVGLPESTAAFDVTNACIGFSNGLSIVASWIEAGLIKAGVVVSGENTRIIIDSNFRLVEREGDKMNREDLLKILPTFTLGCGAVAFVLCHRSLATTSHKLVGGAAKSATEHADLCSGNADFGCVNAQEVSPIMNTDSAALIASAAKLGGRTWVDASEALGWTKEDVNHVFCHQVGRQVNDNFYRELGLDYSKDFSVYKNLGNMVSAAMPIAMCHGAKELPLKEKDKVVCLAYGSGLNAFFFGLEW